MTIKCLKLITGETIIGEVEESSDIVSVETPAAIILQQTEDGRVSASFAAFTPYAKFVKFKTSAIIAEVMIDDRMADEYRRIFGSGLVVATANQLPK